MASPYTWHPGIDRVASKWTVSVPLLPDEIISSWLVRASLAQGCDPLVLTGYIWPKWRVWTIDADRTLSEERIKPLSSISGIPVETFRETTLYPIAKRILGGIPPEKTVWPWILALGARNTKRRGGLQYCPFCLTEDANPYYRLQWRLAWHTGCEKHKYSLLDRCHACGAPLEPHRLLAEDCHAAACATCKADLRKAIPNICHTNTLALQCATDSVISQKHGLFQGQTVDVSEWFELVGFFVSLLRRTNRSGTEALRDLLKRVESPLPDGLPVMAGAGIELLRTHERQNLFEYAWILLNTSREQFETALNESGITRQGFCNQREIIPDVLSTAVKSLPDRPVKHPRKLQRETNAPRPHNEVVRMMERLQRKIEMMHR